MELIKFKVENFRSVEDSGWISVDRIGAFIGVNESGKTNLLTPLWKLNPAQEGEIQPTSDYPKKLFGTIRAKPTNYWFISAIFRTGDLADNLTDVTGRKREELETVQVWRNFAGNYYVSFPGCKTLDTVAATEIESELKATLEAIETIAALAKEDAIRAKMLAVLNTEVGQLGAASLKAPALRALIDRLAAA